MQELVFGSNPNHGYHESVLTTRTQALVDSTLAPRHFVMVSAVDYKAIQGGKVVVLWTARMSADAREGRFEDVVATLIARGAPFCGEDSGGPRVTLGPVAANP
jgi:hypothetical protein